MIRFALIVTTAVTLGAAPLVAQSFQGRDRSADRIPPGLMPPPGMCRVWIDGVPAGQQPAPTDCASAVRNRPSNGRVIFGDDVRRRKFKAKSAAWGLNDSRRGRDDRWSRDGRFDDLRTNSARTTSDRCEDRNRDGRCDDAGGASLCADRNRDGYCDSKVRIRNGSREVYTDGKWRRVPR
jgi:hypothetical protein